MKFQCTSCSWKRFFDANDLNAALQASKEFNTHELADHPEGAGYSVVEETDGQNKDRF